MKPQKPRVKIKLKKDFLPLRKDQIIEATELDARDMIANNWAERVDG